MKRAVAPLRWLTLLVLVASLVSPLTVSSALAQEPEQDQEEPESTAAATGALRIVLTDDAGTLLPGGAFRVTDASGAVRDAADAADGLDGVTNVGGLAEGNAAVVQTAGPRRGYSFDPRAAYAAAIPAGGTAELAVTNRAIVQEPQIVDADGDGVDDAVDNCAVANPNQTDTDGDLAGDACDATPNGDTPAPPDADSDGLADDADNCPNASNPGQEDADGDTLGDACDETPNGDQPPDDDTQDPPAPKQTGPTTSSFVVAQSDGGVVVPGNPSCASVDQDFDETWLELKVDPPAAGSSSDGTLTVTISNIDEHFFDWSSNIGVDAVIAKGGPDGNLYRYDPEATSDTGLHAPLNDGQPFGLSHISFCYDVEPPAPDVQITKTADASPINAGETAGYTITVTNIGNADATNVVVTDTLPGGTWTLTPSQGTGCSGTSGTVTCDLGTIPVGSSATITVGRATTVADCGDLINLAEVSADNDVDLSNNGPVSATITVNCPDVAIEKTASATEVTAGDPVSYTITVTNNGPGTATNIHVDDILPAGIAWAENPDTDECSIAGQELDCDVASLTEGATFSVTVTGATGSGDCGVLTNTATVSADGDTDPDNNSSTAPDVTVNCPDLALEKTPDGAEITAGEDAVFTITITNVGTGTATDVSVNDTLPGGAWDVSPSQGDCDTPATGTFTCTLGDVAEGGVVTITVSRATATDGLDCGLLENAATVSAAVDVDDTNDSDTGDITVLCPDVAVEKTTDTGTISAGDTARFTISVTNVGSGTATDVTLNDPLPGDIDWTIADDTSGTCEITGGDLSCGPVNLEENESFSVTVEGVTDAADCGTLDNTATVDAAVDTNPANDTATAAITVNCAVIEVEKTPDAGSVTAGDQIGFTITVRNTGAGIARDVELTDTLPTNPGLAWTIDGGTGAALCGIAGGVLECDFDDLNPDDVIDVHISSPTTAATCGTVNNTAEVTTSNDGADEASASVTVNCPDVTVEKGTDTPVVNSGDDVRYTVVVTNIGAGAATDVVVTDDLPDAVAWTIDLAVAGCEIDGSGDLSCAFASLPPDQPVTITVVGTVPDDFCGELVNTATVGAGNEPGAATGNNSSGPVTITVNCPNVTVSKVADAAAVSAGQAIGFTITVTNEGPGTATDVTLSDTLPANPGLSWTIDGGTGEALCAINGGVLACDFLDMLEGDVLTVHISSPTTAATCGTVDNTATVAAANEPPANEGDNSAAASVQVLCPGLNVVKEGNGPISAGEDAVFTITVSNTGQGTAFDVTLTDDLPDGVDWADDSADCTIDPDAGEVGQVLDCAFGDLDPSQQVVVTLTGTTDAADCGALDNTATVDAANADPVSDAATIVVQCPNLAIDKTADTSPINAGETASYTIEVSNAGPGVAFDVTVEDTLPPGDWDVATDTGTCDTPATGSFGCDLGDLADDQVATITVSRETTAADCGTLLNLAEADASNDDPVSDSAAIVVNCPDIVVDKRPVTNPITAGDTAAFVITVANAGEGVARDVTLTDNLPAGVDWEITATDGVDAGCAISGPVGSEILACGPVDLDAGAGFSVTVSGETDAADCGPLDNTATAAAANEPADALANNEDAAEIEVRCPDVVVIKDAVTSPISAGDTASFSITVRNDGTGVARDVTLTDALPDGVDWADDSADCTITPDTDETGQVLDCVFGDLDPGASITITVSGETDAADCGPLDNTATAAAANEPADALANNSDGASITVNCADILIDKEPDAASVSAGDPIGFTITVTNTGAGIARDVELSDTLPTNPGLSWAIDGGTGQASCGIGGGILECAFGDLDPDESVDVHISSPTTAATCGQIDNTATVTTSNDGASQDSASVTVNCPNVTVVKTGNGPISAGEDAVFTITVGNAGPGVARNVSLTDSLPDGVDWSDDSADCTITPDTGETGQVLDCTLGDFDPGQQVVVTLTGTTDAADCGDLVNTAVVAADNEADTSDNSSTATIAVLCPDVTVEKRAGSDAVDAGDPVSFTIDVTNLGPGQAVGVEFFDTLPAQVDWTLADDPSGVCALTGAVGSEVLHCGPVDLGDDESFTVTVTGVAGPEDCGTIENTVTVSADNEPADALGNNTSTAGITVDCPDIQVIKEAAESPISAGETAIFTISVTNVGDGIARDVTLTDALPDGVDWVDDSAACAIDPDAGEAGQVLDCAFGDLDPGAGFSVTVEGVTDAADCVTLENIAVGSAANEPADALENNSDDAAIVVNCPNVTVTKTADEDPVVATEPVGFTIVVTNEGPGTAEDVTLTDPLPPNVEWTTETEGCAITDGVLECDFGDLDEGESRTVEVVGPTDPEDCGVLTSPATVTSPNEAPANQGDNTAEASITVLCPDVHVQVTADEDLVVANDPLGFTIVVSNDGEGTAFNVTLAVPVPDGIPWTTDTSGCAIEGGVVSCSFGDLEPGETRDVRLDGVSDPEHCTVLPAPATVAADNESAADQEDNTDEDSIEVLCPDVHVQAIADDPVVTAGEEAGFTIIVSNDKPGTARGVTMESPLPAGVTWTLDNVTEGGSAAFVVGASLRALPAAQGDDFTAAQVDCELVGETITCTAGDMEFGETFSLHISGVTNPGLCGELRVTPVVAATNESAFDQLDNTSTDLLITVACPDVTVEKSGNGPISAGDEAAFTLTVRNDGEGVALDVTLIDELPAGLDWTIEPAVEGCAITDGTLECALGDFGSGDEVTITVTAPTTSADCGELPNTATVAAENEPESESGNNSDSASILVTCGNVQITKVLCVTTKPHDVAFLVIAPDGAQTGDDNHDPKKCTPVKDVEFSIDGDAIDDPITVTTDAAGRIDLDLPPGDYTITEESTGASAEFGVEVDGTTLIKVFNFKVKKVEKTPTPTPTPKPEAPTKLPDTGAGPAGDLDGGSWLILFVAVVVVGGAGYALRRRAA